MTMPTAVPHISDGQLEAYALRRLSEVETTAIEEHLLTCEKCRNSLE
jgi:hypothetical protein